MGAEVVHNSPETVERAPKNPENAIALGEIAVHDGADIAELSTDNHGDDGGRWDAGKAETMAGVLQANPTKMEKVAGEWQEVEVEDGANLYEQARYDGRNYIGEDRLLPEYRRKEVDERRTGPQSVVNGEWKMSSAKDIERAKREVERFDENLNENVDKILSPYTTFYELNADRFATMPTKEFMALAEHYDLVLQQLEQQEFANPYFLDGSDTYRGHGGTIRKYEKMLKESSGEPMSAEELGSDADVLFRRIGTTTVQDYKKEHGIKGGRLQSAEYGLTEMFETLEEGKFDTTPRQLVEKQLAALKELQEMSERSLAELQVEKQRLEDEAKSVSAQ